MPMSMMLERGKELHKPSYVEKPRTADGRNPFAPNLQLFQKDSHNPNVSLLDQKTFLRVLRTFWASLFKARTWESGWKPECSE